MNCIWYDSAKECWDAHEQGFLDEIFKREGLRPEDLEEGGWEASDGSTCTNAEALAAIEDLGYWGHCDTNSNTIHIWSGNATDEQLAMLIGHELGHASGVRVDGFAEEIRADTYGAVAVETIHLLKQKPIRS